MPTFSLSQFLRRIGLCALSLVAGVSACVALLLLASNPSSHAQAAEGQAHPLVNIAPPAAISHPDREMSASATVLTEALPTRASAEWWAVVKDQLAEDGSIGAASVMISSGLTLTGEITNSYFGYSVATAGDVNGDGYDDVIVGAFTYNNFAGRVYVYYGSAAGLNATPAFILTGSAPNNLGVSVSTAGDVNNDGYDDVIIGANITNTGGASIYFGSAAGLSAASVFTLTDSNFFGYIVGSAGDVNGDGYSDIMVGWPDYNNEIGRAYVFLGNAAGVGASPVFTATGEPTHSFLGFSLGTTGDINQDGYDDVIIGAPVYLTSTGRAYVYLSNGSGLTSTPALTVTGEATHNQLGISVGTAGDVNGDGYADVVIGASRYQSDIGRIYLYLGSATGMRTTPDFISTGDSLGGGFGYSAATAGDMNGDGYSDLIVGAPGYNLSTGRAYVFYGSGKGLQAAPVLVMTGVVMTSAFGESVYSAGDVNGDGYSDVVIGAPSYVTNTGQAYIYYGSARAPDWTWSAVSEANERGNYYYFGWSVGTAGDVNGDSYADVIVGAPYYFSATGRAYVYLGSASGLNFTPTFTAAGGANGDYFGWSVGTAGDVNNDGYDDIVIGAKSYNNNQGRAFVYLGGSAGVGSTPAFTLTGQPGDNFGQAVATAGDVNNDGFADIIIGAPGTGRAYLFLGSVSGLSATPALTLTQGGNWGFAVGTAGDVDDDSYSDVIVGGPGTSIGMVNVYLGGASGLNPTPAFTVTGGISEAFGYSAGTAGDVNGDGYSDIVVGAPAYASRAGRAYVYLGGGSGPSAAPAFTATGEFPNSYLGFSVGTAGDMNGDSYADVIIGLPAESYSSPITAGQVQVYFGSANGLSLTPGFSVSGDVTVNGILGWSVGAAGDVDNDGYPEVIAGDLWYRGWGGVFVYSGSPGGVSDLSLTQTATPTLALPGQAITYSLLYINHGPNTAIGVVITDLVPGELMNVENTYSGAAITPTAGITYSWQVADLAPGEGGVITITGVLSPGLLSGTLVNTATITTTNPESNFADNTSAAVLTIVPNTPPIAADDAYTVTENLPLTVAAPGVLANDADTDGPVSLTAFTVTNPLTGSLAFNPDGSFVYAPTLNFTGVVTFTYRANDGLANSNSATVIITVTPVNDVPVATNDTYTATESLSLIVTAPGVLANDADTDGPVPLTAFTVTNPLIGSLAFNADGSFVYTPTLDFTGVVTFTYQANDGLANSNTATVTITVAAPGIKLYLPLITRQ